MAIVPQRRKIHKTMKIDFFAQCFFGYLFYFGYLTTTQIKLAPQMTMNERRNFDANADERL